MYFEIKVKVKVKYDKAKKCICRNVFLSCAFIRQWFSLS